MDTYTRGDHHVALNIASNTGLLNQAKEELQERSYSSTSTRPREARFARWSKIMLEAGIQNPFELTPDSIITGAVVLRSAGFRSTMAYVDQEFVRRGGARSQQTSILHYGTRAGPALAARAPSSMREPSLWIVSPNS